MPITVNLSGGGAQLGTVFVRSVVYRAFASVADQSVEVAAATARYFVGHFFSGNNGTGTDFGQASIDTTDLILTHFGKANIQDTLVAIFPPFDASN
jgi:hypothetical protein